MRLKMIITVIITCYNRKDKTQQCIRTLINHNPTIHFQFLVIDDGSTDGTSSALQQFENITVLRGNGDMFYTGGMHKGISFAKTHIQDVGDYVLFCNDDVEFFENTVERLVRYKPSIDAIVVGATCDSNGKLSYGGVLKTLQWRPKFEIVMSTKKEVQHCDTFNANCVLIPTSVFRVLPNMDTAYHHSLGDFDYGLVASQRGISIVASDFFVGCCNDNPPIGTWLDTTLSRWERLRRKEQTKGYPFRESFYFANKHYGILAAIYTSITPYVRILIKK